MNATFKDCKNREWKIKITWGAVKRIRDDLNIDLSDFSEKNNFVKLLVTDNEKLVDTLWALLEKQAKTMKWIDDEEPEEEQNKVGVDALQFADGFSGDEIVDAIQAFIDAMVEFYPEKKRKAVLMTFMKMQETETQGYGRVENEIDQIDPAKELDKVFGPATNT